jgi:large subunit ribosomal protein L9
MAKEMILMADVEGLGVQGDVVRVRDGFARNFLLPKALAAPVTETTRRRLQKLQAERAVESAAKLVAAKEVAARLQKATCSILVKAGEDGKLFGSVTAQHVADLLKSKGIELDRRQIELEQPIHELGDVQVPVRLHPELTVSVKVSVVKE